MSAMLDEAAVLAELGITHDPASLRRAAARGSLKRYMTHMTPKLPRPRHLDVLTTIADEITALTHAGSVIVISMPPQHMKSVTISQHLPSYYLGHHPDHQVLLLAYNATKAEDYSRGARQHLEDDRYPFDGLTLADDTRSVYQWSLAKPHRGTVRATGVGGAVTGVPANLIIADDLIKDHTDAMSETLRAQAWNYLLTSALTRQNQPCTIVLIGTRWHEDDVIGRVLAQDAYPVTDIKLAAIREDGSELWPAAEGGPVDYGRQQKLFGAYWFQCIYQQDPIPESGNMFKREWFRYFTVSEDRYVLPDYECAAYSCTRFATVDPAFSAKEEADYTAVATWALTPKGDLLVLNMTRFRGDETDIITKLKEIEEEWHPAAFYVEHVGYSTRTITQAQRAGLKIIELHADRDKRTRAIPATMRYEAGGVFHRKGAPWLDDFEAELTRFPRGTHDDQVDTVSYGVQRALDHLPDDGTAWPRYSIGRAA